MSGSVDVAAGCAAAGPCTPRLGGCSVAELAGTKPQSTGFLQLGSCREMFLIALAVYSLG